jgi:hypothetical protein
VLDFVGCLLDTHATGCGHESMCNTGSDSVVCSCSVNDSARHGRVLKFVWWVGCKWVGYLRVLLSKCVQRSIQQPTGLQRLFLFVQVLCESMECLRIQKSMKRRHPSLGKSEVFIPERQRWVCTWSQSGVEHHNSKAISCF